MNLKYRAAAAVAVIAAILAVAVAYIFYQENNSGKKSEKYAYIYSGGQLVRTVNLAEEEDSSFEIVSEDGGVNVVGIKDGSIGVTEADCPDGLCVNMGYIDSSVLPVVCLPNQLVIRVENDSADNEVDAVAY